MGLAASQARLLSLTSRQHTVEHRAQFLQAQKVRLANDSDAVYEKYINALDATKLETRAYDTKGKVHWVDGSLSNLLRYSADDKAAGNIYYVQNIKDGKLYMPKDITNAYNSSGEDLYKFLDSMNVKYDRYAYSESYLQAKANLDNDIALGWNEKPFNNDDTMAKYAALASKVDYPDYSDTYNAAQNIYDLVNYSQNGTKTSYLPCRNEQLQELKDNLNYLSNNSSYKNDSTIKKISEYCNSFDVPDIFNNTDSINKLTASPNKRNEYYISYDKSKEDEKENPETRQSIGDIFKLRMLLSGGTYTINGDDDALTKYSIYEVIGTPKEADTNNDNKVSIAEYERFHEITNYVYSEDMRNFLKDNYNENINIGDILMRISQNIKNDEYSKAVQKAETDLNNFLSTHGTDQNTIKARIRNYQQYNEDLVDFNLQSTETHTEYADSVLGKYYENMFNAIKSAGGCVELADEQVKSSSWVNNMIKNAQVVLAVYNTEREEIDNVSASSNSGIREVSNDAEINKIDLEYETDLEAINSKETKYNTQLNQLEAERNAIQTEIESLKKIAKENIESTFKLFS